MKILHVGFGKTATTSLQRVVFPKICDHFSLGYVNTQNPRIRFHRALLELGKEVNEAENFDNSLVSSEGLCSWDPFFWNDWAIKNALYFGRDSHVFLVIREPESYLKSVYVQRCLHEGNVVPPDKFFLDNSLYSPYLSSAKFSIEEFSYKNIMSAYVSNFDRVTVAKYEDISDLVAIKEMLSQHGLFFDHWSELSDTFLKSRTNPSYNNLAAKLTFRVHRLLKVFGFSLSPSEMTSSEVYLESLADGNKAKDYRVEKSSFFIRVLGLAASFLTWRSLMTKFVSRFSKRKFDIRLSQIKGLDLQALKAEYEAVPSIVHFHRGVDINESG